MTTVRDSGSADAQAVLFRRHWGRLVRAARRYTGDGHAAEDLASEAICRTLRRLCAGAEISSFPRYAQMVAKNLHVDAHRGRLTLVLVDEYHEISEGAHLRDEMADADLTIDLAAVLDQLGPRHREILRLTILEDIPTHEAAVMMGIKPNAAASLALRARTSLRAAYFKNAIA